MFALIDRRMLTGTLLAVAMGTAGAAGAPNDSPDDYAQRIEMTVSGKQAIVQLPLPPSVYQAARTPDLRDLRVFDAEGRTMPFALTRHAEQEQRRSSKAPVAVFPVRVAADSEQRLQESLQIRTGASGAVISVTTPAARGAADVLGGLVLELRPPSNSATEVAALALMLPAGVANYNAELVLETSDDLEHWEELAQASVSWLANSQGASVRKDRIAFAPRAFRYARLRWLDGKPLEFAAIEAEYVERTQAARQRDSLLLEPRAAENGDLVYAAPVAIPVEAIGLQFQAQNVVMPVLIGQYRKVRGRDGRMSDQLDPLVNTTFFQMTQNGQLRASGDVEVPPTHAAQWVLRPQGAVTERPALRLRWSGASMVFLAGGKGPYTLAVGRAGVPSVQVPLAQVAPGFSAAELAALEQARAGAPVQQISGTDPLEAQRDASSRRSIWLWALLVAGVVALGAMAWRLSRQLKEAPAAGESGQGEAGGPPAA